MDVNHSGIPRLVTPTLRRDSAMMPCYFRMSEDEIHLSGRPYSGGDLLKRQYGFSHNVAF